MIIKAVCAAGAGVLLSASIGMAIPRGGLVSGTAGAAATAPIEIAGKHARSSSSSSSSSSSASAKSWSARSSSSGGRSSGSSASGNRRWSVSPAHRSHVVAPFRTNAAPHATYSTPHVARPRARFARRLVPLAALSTIYIGSRYYYPYRYLPYDGPVCSGVTENGCELQWMDVPTEDGGETATQCVEFCPQQ